jgi:hypothetical protein
MHKNFFIKTKIALHLKIFSRYTLKNYFCYNYAKKIKGYI